MNCHEFATNIHKYLMVNYMIIHASKNSYVDNYCQRKEEIIFFNFLNFRFQNHL